MPVNSWTKVEAAKFWELLEDRLKDVKRKLLIDDFKVIKVGIDSHFAGLYIEVGDELLPRGGIPFFATVRCAYPERTANCLHTFVNKRKSETDKERNDRYQELIEKYEGGGEEIDPDETELEEEDEEEEDEDDLGGAAGSGGSGSGGAGGLDPIHGRYDENGVWRPTWQWGATWGFPDPKSLFK